jgi:tRNA-dihydrouridine synthase B
MLSPTSRHDTVLHHGKLMATHKGTQGALEMRKHLVWYFKGFPNASAVRQRLIQLTSYEELEGIVAELRGMSGKE